MWMGSRCRQQSQIWQLKLHTKTVCFVYDQLSYFWMQRTPYMLCYKGAKISVLVKQRTIRTKRGDECPCLRGKKSDLHRPMITAEVLNNCEVNY